MKFLLHVIIIVAAIEGSMLLTKKDLQIGFDNLNTIIQK